MGLTNIEVRFLHFYAGFPRIAYAPKMTNHDRRVAAEIVKHMAWVADADDVEYIASVEDEIEAEETKYPEVYDEYR